MDANHRIPLAYAAETLCTCCLRPLKDAVRRPSKLIGAIVCAYCLHVGGELPPATLDTTQPMNAYVAVESTITHSTRAFSAFMGKT